MKRPVATGRRVLERLAPWVALAAGLSFTPLILWHLVILIFGTPGGFIYFGHNPEYVLPVQRWGTDYYIAEVGGGWLYRLPSVYVPAQLGLEILIAYAILAVTMAIAADTARWRVRLGAEKRWLNRAATGKCPECGYDVRATPKRCPECGCELGAKAHAYRRWVRRMCLRWAMPHADLLLRHLARLVL